MQVKPEFCARCGGHVVLRRIDERSRAVCPKCDIIFYENPLPVAASIVLNDQREVLLVKRQRAPYQGQWCLPMGFAERGETIAAAALRELHEETGLEAIVLRLIDADSFDSSIYGDLLIVTFEMQKVGGAEQAGDDAEEVRYFSLHSTPPLPFESNAKALRACAAAHEEGWAIQDSFYTLHANEDSEMLSDALVALIEARADEIAGIWLIDVRTNPTTRSYSQIPPDRLMERATAALTQFGRWLKGDEAADELREFYHRLAEERCRQGMECHELISSLMLLKKNTWRFAQSQGIWERPIDMYRVLELSRRVAAFFDKAIYHALRGFEQTQESGSAEPPH